MLLLLMLLTPMPLLPCGANSGCVMSVKREAGECQKFTPILRENTELWDESK